MPLRRSFLLHYSEQLRVEINGCILAPPLQFFIHRSDLNQARHVPAWADWNRHMRHFKPKDLVKFPIQPDAVDLVHREQVFKRNNEVQALVDSNTANPEDLCHIDNANPAHFHMIAGELRRRGHELAALQHRNPRHIVSYQAVTTFDQSKHTLAFSNTTRSAN